MDQSYQLDGMHKHRFIACPGLGCDQTWALNVPQPKIDAHAQWHRRGDVELRRLLEITKTNLLLEGQVPACQMARCVRRRFY